MNLYGIMMQNCYHVIMTGNICANNTGTGINLYRTQNLTLSFNTISENSYGLGFTDCNSVVISYNKFLKNDQYAIYLRDAGSTNTTIHHNSFIDNYLEWYSQAYGGGTNILWYDINTNEGNYWSNWSGSGSYQIAGSTLVDPYPLIDPPI